MRERILSSAENKIVIHHGKNDLLSLGIDPLAVRPRNIIFVDTTFIFQCDRGHGPQPVCLKSLAQIFLSRDIQTSSHNSTEDAKTLYEVFQATVVKNMSTNIHISSVPPKENQIFKIRCLCHFKRSCECTCRIRYSPNLFECRCDCKKCNSEAKVIEIKSPKDYKKSFN